VPEVPERAPAGAELPAVQPQPALHLGQDRRPAGVHRPEHVAVGELVRRLRVLLHQLLAEGLHVGLDDVGEFAAELELDALLRQPPVDGLVGVGEEPLQRRVELEQRALHRCRVGADHGRAGAVAEEGDADEVVGAVGAGRAEPDDGGLGGGEEDARTRAALGEALGDAEARDAARAAGERQHDAADVRAEAQRARQVEVSAGEPRLAGGDVDKVGDLRERAAPGADAGERRLRRHLRHRLVGDVQPLLHRRLALLRQLRVALEDLLR
ncbi:Os07g0411566, partial [Oryza sativa Japonica Group]